MTGARGACTPAWLAKSRLMKDDFLQPNICTEATNVHSEQLPACELRPREAAAHQERV